jgi:hypothetical protein
VPRLWVTSCKIGGVALKGRHWLGIATAVWALAVAVTAYVAARTGSPTAREQTTLAEARATVDQAVIQVAASAGNDVVLAISGYELSTGCRITSARRGTSLDRVIRLYTPAGTEPALLKHLAQTLPRSYHAGLTHHLTDNTPTTSPSPGVSSVPGGSPSSGGGSPSARSPLTPAGSLAPGSSGTPGGPLTPAGPSGGSPAPGGQLTPAGPLGGSPSPGGLLAPSGSLTPGGPATPGGPLTSGGSLAPAGPGAPGHSLTPGSSASLLRADAGNYVGLRGEVSGAGEVRVEVDGGCRTGSDLGVAAISPDPTPSERAPALAALAALSTSAPSRAPSGGASPSGLAPGSSSPGGASPGGAAPTGSSSGGAVGGGPADRWRTYQAPCPKGGTLRTIEVISQPFAVSRPLPELLGASGPALGSPTVVLAEPQRYAYRTGTTGVAIRVDTDSVTITATTPCP